jgi:hypothetical protein
MNIAVRLSAWVMMCVLQIAVTACLLDSAIQSRDKSDKPFCSSNCGMYVLVPEISGDVTKSVMETVVCVTG